MRGVAPGPCPGAWRPHPWSVGKVALFEACFVRFNLYKYSYCFQLWLLSAPCWFQLRLLSTPATFTVCRVSSVLSSSSRQNQTNAGGAACFRLPWLAAPQCTHRRPIVSEIVNADVLRALWCARRGAALSRCQHGQQTTGISRSTWRG